MKFIQQFGSATKTSQNYFGFSTQITMSPEYELSNLKEGVHNF